MKKAISTIVIIVYLGVAALMPPSHAQSPGIVEGTIRALVVGIDHYNHLPALRGAAADARDLDATLRKLGAVDIRLLLDSAATRQSVVTELARLAERTSRGDTVFLTLSGYGRQQAVARERMPAILLEDMFLLADFEPNSQVGQADRMDANEFKSWIADIESKGARVIFVADASYGESIVREFDPRDNATTYRTALFQELNNDPSLVGTIAESQVPPAAIKNSVLLTAADDFHIVPELSIPEVGVRGALSYAVARALEGAADLDHDGHITGRELVAYVERVTYQLSDERQRIQVESAQDTASGSIDQEKNMRGINVVPASNPSKSNAVIAATHPDRPTQERPDKDAGQNHAIVRPQPERPSLNVSPVRVASLDGQASHFQDLYLHTAIQVVSSNANPDLLWDPMTLEILSGGDVIARNIEKPDLPAAIERAAAVRWLKTRATSAPQSIRVLPDDQVHHGGSDVQI